MYLIEILHQTTTRVETFRLMFGLYLIEILHQTTTPGNHPLLASRLYLIEILHQTTTVSHVLLPRYCCILSKFYIKPQPRWCCLSRFWRCILSKFYIKPQLLVMYSCHATVVSYRNSTSNHNPAGAVYPGFGVVSYRNSTSNHNIPVRLPLLTRLYLIEILHQTTTTLMAIL